MTRSQIEAKSVKEIISHAIDILGAVDQAPSDYKFNKVKAFLRDNNINNHISHNNNNSFSVVIGNEYKNILYRDVFDNPRKVAKYIIRQNSKVNK